MAYVYRMYVGNEVKYVGYTGSMVTRMSTHYRSTPDTYGNSVLSIEQVKKVTKIEYIETNNSNARVLEAYLIAKIKPEWNKDFVESDELTYKLVTGDLEWKEWEIRIHDNPHHHIFIWKDGELLYEIPKVHKIYDELCKEFGIEQDMEFGYSVPVYSKGYKLMRLSGKRHIRNGSQRQTAKYSYMGYPEAFNG